MKKKYTFSEGPWEEQRGSHRIRSARVGTTGHLGICDMLGNPGAQEIADANARLIIAAPDLLATLEYILGRLPAHDTQSIAQAKAAIAKAKGQL